jgi:hypothetical protein
MNKEGKEVQMKKQGKRAGDSYLHKTNNRWKWMAGATAATAAGVTATQANTITVNLVNNYISGSGGNHLNADLTGDGHPDMTIANAFYFFHSSPSISTFATKGDAGVNLNGVFAYAYHSGHYPLGTVKLGSKTGFWAAGSGTSYLNGSIPITFKDLHINNGKLTKGLLDVTVNVFGPHGPGEIDLNSFTYNTPDQGSSLALLAMGASGILSLRRWRAAQERP